MPAYWLVLSVFQFDSTESVKKREVEGYAWSTNPSFFPGWLSLCFSAASARSCSFTCVHGILSTVHWLIEIRKPKNRKRGRGKVRFLVRIGPYHSGKGRESNKAKPVFSLTFFHSRNPYKKLQLLPQWRISVVTMERAFTTLLLLTNTRKKIIGFINLLLKFFKFFRTRLVMSFFR